ncbi:hypothetical protein [Paenibacillus sp. FSL H7-0331]|uniref:hypothetical protein n=1 Tax=Paenibacillus sp. FSL H7-0331 TaxID=1920421 RepID=UPI0015C3F7E1|nr:hypothetical protein [Paenibacillus sp. FSL H7-0331]
MGKTRGRKDQNEKSQIQVLRDLGVEIFRRPDRTPDAQVDEDHGGGASHPPPRSVGGTWPMPPYASCEQPSA